MKDFNYLIVQFNYKDKPVPLYTYAFIALDIFYTLTGISLEKRGQAAPFS